jgi:hypothetical protein
MNPLTQSKNTTILPVLIALTLICFGFSPTAPGDLYASDVATNSATGLNSPQGIFPPKADFNGDGKSDILWQNNSTGERVIWLMNGTSLISSVSLGVVGTSWNIVGSEDFNRDLNSDILWQNSVTGERVIWLMNGTSLSSTVSLGIVGTSWSIVGSGDFNADGMPDILWQNNCVLCAASAVLPPGERVIWLMNGTSFSSSVSLGIVGTSWNIAGAADYSGDGQTDILWQNSVTGERVIWLMNGTSLSSTVSLGIVWTAWDIRNY